MKKIIRIISISTFSVAILLLLSFMFTDITMNIVSADSGNCGQGVYNQLPEPYAPRFIITAIG